jgi:hypothetical protein
MVPSPRQWGSWWHAVLRWTLLIAATGFAFHDTVGSLVHELTSGDPLGFVLLPYWALLLVVGTTLVKRPLLPVFDRQIDWILAAGLLALLGLIDGLLVPQLGLGAPLVRVDVYSLLLFLAIGCLLCFGARATGHYWLTWVFLFACCPVTYLLIGAALGGTTLDYALMNVVVSALVVGLATSGAVPLRLGWAGATVVIGEAVAVAMHHSAPVALELVPALVAPVLPLTIAWWRGNHAPIARRHVARGPSVRHPVVGTCVLVICAASFGLFVNVAPATVDVASLPSTAPGWTSTPVVPVGWRATSHESEGWADRYFGAGATLTRTWFEPGAARVAAPIVVDVLTATQSGPLSLYPAVSLYRFGEPYVQAAEATPLGDGVQADLFYADPDTAASPFDAAWVMYSWLWRFTRHGTTYLQQINVLTTDGTADSLGIPPLAAPGSSGTLRAIYVGIVRGLNPPSAPPPSGGVIARLDQFSSSLVATQNDGPS